MRDYLLHKSFLYTTFQKSVGALKARKIIIERLEIKPGDKILDIGCGPADILDYLPQHIEYTGVDNNVDYVVTAKKQFKNRGNFFCKEISNDLLKDKILKTDSFDMVLAFGILHHLTDEKAISLFELAKAVLIKGGRLVTLDGCFTQNQSAIAKSILKMDRGDFVRNEQEYLKLANHQFVDITSEIYSNLFNIPYTLIVMKGIKN
ncbi:MAG: class I SAM-dependent methyltransferase [Actinobacteria bacterium]|nr:class I SAM-dependent methyltransferase [Actinomycetota bacterium]